MKTLMMLASMLVVGAGTFCLANSSVAFISVAFIVGLSILILGIVELLLNRMTVKNSYETHGEMDVEALLSVILGAVFLITQMQEETAVVMTFALWITIEGLKSISQNGIQFRINLDLQDAYNRILGAVMTLFGVYMFFNSMVFNLKVTFMVGIVLVLMGLSRFRIALAIEYKRPEFITSNKEKLKMAEVAEKDAMQRAKEAIRESKEIQRRIVGLKEEIENENRLNKTVEGGRLSRRMKKFK